MKIVFTGAQGVGKTTLLDILEKCFTYNEPIKFIRNVTRNIAKKGFSINESGDDATQLVLMEAHKDIIKDNCNVIMDRSVLDVMSYTIYLYRQGKVSKEVYEKCLDTFVHYVADYDKIYYIKPEFPITGDEYRSDKEQYQKDIAAIFEELINKYDIKVTRLTGAIGDRLKFVLDELKEQSLIKC